MQPHEKVDSPSVQGTYGLPAASGMGMTPPVANGGIQGTYGMPGQAAPAPSTQT